MKEYETKSDEYIFLGEGKARPALEKWVEFNAKIKQEGFQEGLQARQGVLRESIDRLSLLADRADFIAKQLWAELAPVLHTKIIAATNECNPESREPDRHGSDFGMHLMAVSNRIAESLDKIEAVLDARDF